MGILIEELEIEGDRGKRKVQTLFDTGASQSLIREETVGGIATILNLPHPLRFEMGDGEGVIEATKVANLFIAVNGVTINDQVVVVKKLGDEMIIGARTMQGWKIKIDMENEKVIIDPRVARLRLG
ncbi:MAG: retropepsin-like aspartic protease [bacterium]|nr:retropepsin-like aspartic protease [bacterium]